ncbi:aminodeoxychorismate synthase component I [Cytophagales bacterium WSM2-2]|nr:aminodeoxychorismate synthase component I [Cytophagales bacterium WSM2-2]
MNILEFESLLNQWGRERQPFLCIIDFEMEAPVAWKLNDVPREILYSINGIANFSANPTKTNSLELAKYPMSFADYESRFNQVKESIGLGDSYLTNLTIKTRIDLKTIREDLFFQIQARYKVLWKNKFIVFSPETFIRIENGIIHSFPMKGTIDAAIPDAERIILEDPKELSEHVTIVDLIRNDLSHVANDVKVERFRYVEKVKTNQKDLLQVSSEITGKLSENYGAAIGSILVSLLPAGSISGAPKKKTVQIIRDAEKEKRGYYTGVIGYFDGKNFDSGVMIRFVEEHEGKLYYRSGGGITSQSVAEKEYQEAIDKIYVPVH